MAPAPATRARRALITSYFVLSIAFSLLNRWSLGLMGFRFPLLLTAVHSLFGFLFGLPSALATPGSKSAYLTALNREAPGIALVAVASAANVLLSNWSLEYLSLSLHQVIRALVPAATAAFAAAADRRWPPTQEVLGLSLLCLGAATSIDEARVSGDALGVGLALASVAAAAAALTFTARVLQGRVDSTQLAFFSAPVSAACMFPAAAAFERRRLATYVAVTPATAAGILLAGSLVAGVHSVLHNDVVALTDPVTTCVLGQVKIVTLLGVAAWMFDEGRGWTARMSFGLSAAIAGFSIFTWSKLRRGGVDRHADGSKTPRKGRRGGTPKRQRAGGPESPGEVTTPPATLPGLKTPTSRAPPMTSPQSRRRWRTPASLV